MKKSIGDNMIPKGMSFEDGLKLIKQSGYDGIELWLGDRPWFQMNTSDADLRTLYSKVTNAGLEVSNVSNSLDWDENISDRDPARREAAARHIKRQIEACHIFQTDAILVVAGVVRDDNPYNEVYNRCVYTLGQLAGLAAQAKIKIGVENCCSEQKFLLSPREFNGFLKDIGSPWVGIHLDVGNIHDTGFAEQWIEILGPQITRVHLKDVLKHRGRCGNQSVYTNLFLGDNNWLAIRSAFDKAHYDGWLIAEMESRYHYAPDQQFVDTAAAIDRLIKRQL